jgi:hypothetical protein
MRLVENPGSLLLGLRHLITEAAVRQAASLSLTEEAGSLFLQIQTLLTTRSLQLREADLIIEEGLIKRAALRH